MSQHTHTPGPWIPVLATASGDWLIESEKQGSAVARTIGARGAINAGLIAAAPDLLEACKYAAERAAERGDKATLVTLEAAIAKAEGGAE